LVGLYEKVSFSTPLSRFNILVDFLVHYLFSNRFGSIAYVQYI